MRKARARVPLRLGLAGGGTDLSPYCDEYGGNVLNCTVSLYAYASVAWRDDAQCRFSASDLSVVDEMPAAAALPLGDGLRLHRGVYNRIVREFNGNRPLPVEVHSAVDAPPGSGLGSSSALVVALIKAYAELLELPLGDYDLAHLAFEVERIDLALAGGRQDQYAAAFGGCNFIEFLPGDRVIVNPLRVHETHLLEFESSLVVVYTGTSRVSSDIIQQQTEGMRSGVGDLLAAMHQLKRDAVEMKLSLLHGDIAGMADVLGRSWAAKKRTASGVSNAGIDAVYEAALAAGALAGKISGAGGGGFMMLLAPLERRQGLVRRLTEDGCMVMPCQLTDRGAESWTLRR